MSLGIFASQCGNPEKVSGYFQLVWAIGSVALFRVGGEVTVAFAHRGIITLLAAAMPILVPLLFLVPNAAKVNDNEASTGTGPPALLGVLLFAAIVLYVAVSAGFFAFSGPLGQRVGLNTSAVGKILTIPPS